jgi:hypothetical protein
MAVKLVHYSLRPPPGSRCRRLQLEYDAAAGTSDTTLALPLDVVSTKVCRAVERAFQWRRANANESRKRFSSYPI